MDWIYSKFIHQEKKNIPQYFVFQTVANHVFNLNQHINNIFTLQKITKYTSFWKHKKPAFTKRNKFKIKQNTKNAEKFQRQKPATTAQVNNRKESMIGGRSRFGTQAYQGEKTRSAQIPALALRGQEAKCEQGPTHWRPPRPRQ
jgi:hypothetical protein